MKKSILLAGTLLILNAVNSYALPRFTPSRCAHDSLAQWSEGAPLEGTARGRNEWLKVCHIDAYELIYPGGNEIDPDAYTAGQARLSYPTYGKISGTNEKGEPIFEVTGWTAPTTPPSGPGASECIIPTPNRFVGICTAGCVVPETEVTLADGSLKIGELYGLNAEIAVPTTNDHGQFVLENIEVKNQIRDIVATEQEILVIKTISGGEIRVSPNHPLLNGENLMVKARDLKPGDSLVTSDGHKDLITQLSKEKFYGRLYNLTIKTSDQSKSLFIVNGYISGDKKYQDDDASDFNRRIFRKNALFNK